jgi:plastocyanin
MSTSINHTTMRTRMLSAGLAIVAAAACGGGGSNSSGSYNSSNPTSPTPAADDPTPTSPTTVNANPSLDYNPASISVSAGATVTFNFGSVGHSVTFLTAGSPNSVPVTSNAQVGVTFPNTGSFTYHCLVHPYMQGVVNVHQ